MNPLAFFRAFVLSSLILASAHAYSPYDQSISSRSLEADRESASGHSLAIGVIGGRYQLNKSYSGSNLSTSHASRGTSVTGAGLQYGFHSPGATLGFSSDLAYVSKTYQGSQFVAYETENYRQVRVILSGNLFLSDHFAISAGPFASMGLGTVRTNYADGLTDQWSYKSSGVDRVDYGISADVQGNVSFSHSIGMIAGVKYLHGLANLIDNSRYYATDLYSRDWEGMLGLAFTL